MSDTTELVDLAVIFPDLEIELKYACADNITGKAIYQQARCLLHWVVANKSHLPHLLCRTSSEKEEL